MEIFGGIRNFLQSHRLLTKRIMKNNWLFPVATLLVGVAGGYIAGHGPSSSAQSSDDVSTVKTRSERSAGGSDERASSASHHHDIADIRRTPGQSSRIQALMEHFASLKAGEFASEAKKLEALPFQDRIISSYLLFSKWAETAPTEAMKFADTMGFGGMMVRPTILQSWASVDPQNAAKYYAENPREFAMMGMGGPGGGGRGGRGGQNGASIIASEWANQDPAGALAWAKTLNGNDKSSAMSSVISAVAISDPKQAADMTLTMDPAEREKSYDSIAKNWGAKDWTSAEAWIRSLPTDQQQAALASAINGLAGQDPQAAAQKIASMPAGDSRDQAVASVAESMSQSDPLAAAKWLLTQQGDQTQGMRNVMGNLARQDDSAAVSLISSQATGDVRDRMVESYVFSNRASSPQAVMQLAETITDQNQRNRAEGVAAMQWMQQDPEAAKAYVNQSTTMDDQTKQRILNGGGFRGGRGGNGGGAPPPGG